MKQLNIGLFGFGCVGQGLYDVLSNAPRLRADIRRIVVKNRDKPRRLPAEMFAYDRAAVLDDPDIDLVVELIDDATAAYEIVKYALTHGKNVVSANKKMIAEHLEELVALQKAHGTALLYEAACCGSIPIIRNLEEYYDNELLDAFSGIFNGSSNYILSQTAGGGLDYAAAVEEAQAKGFAETDPTLDVGGYDARYKLCILTAHAYGLFVRPEAVLRFGIQHLRAADQRYAREKGLKIKPACVAQKIGNDRVALLVAPLLTEARSPLYDVEDEYNGVVVAAAFSDQQFFQGKGAGGHPTGSAVLSDISACTYGYRYEYKKHGVRTSNVSLTDQVLLSVYISYQQDDFVKELPWRSIREKYFGQDGHYIIGDITLADLTAHQAALEEASLFVALTGPPVEISSDSVKHDEVFVYTSK